jgi:hypothetical protein
MDALVQQYGSALHDFGRYKIDDYRQTAVDAYKAIIARIAELERDAGRYIKLFDMPEVPARNECHSRVVVVRYVTNPYHDCDYEDLEQDEVSELVDAAVSAGKESTP